MTTSISGKFRTQRVHPDRRRAARWSRRAGSGTTDRGGTRDVTVTSDSDVYYDPYDFGIDADPYPVFRKLRDEAPIYYNEKYDFYALSRFEDVDKGLLDWETYRSGKGSVLEIIKSFIEQPLDEPIIPGMMIFEDPPIHHLHRALLSRVFTPRKMNALEPKVREFCARSLDPLVGTGGFDFIGDVGAQMPMRTIGYLLGIPEEDQEQIRDHIDQGLKITEGDVPAAPIEADQHEMFADYIDWRAENPSDDVMTQLLTVEFEDEHGTTRRLTRDEVLMYVGMLAGAGNETTTRLIGWTGKLLAEHPDQRRELVADPSLIPQAIEEILRYEAPSPVQARFVAREVEYYGRTVPEGSVMLLINGSGNRDERRFADPDRFDIHRETGRHLSFGYGIHLCLGAALARLEGRVALDEVLKRFPDWEVDWEHAKQARTSTVRGWETLPVFTS
jgi:cytochrome P450